QLHGRQGARRRGRERARRARGDDRAGGRSRAAGDRRARREDQEGRCRMTTQARFYQVIQEPLLTEKGTDDRGRRNAYHFRVPVDANKIEIRLAIEKLFKVKVLRVNTLRATQKVKRRGYAVGMTPQYKKAMVVLKEGDTIEVI